MHVNAVLGPVAPVEQGQDVVDLLTVVGWLGARLLQEREGRGEPGRGQHGGRVQSFGLGQRQAVGSGARRVLGRRGRVLRPLLDQLGAAAAETEVQSARVQRVDQPELLHSGQCGAVGELNPGGTEPDGVGGGGDERDLHRG